MPDMAVTIRTIQGEALNPASTGAQITLDPRGGVTAGDVQAEFEAVHARIDAILAAHTALEAAVAAGANRAADERA